jgi:hypothetical protein
MADHIVHPPDDSHTLRSFFERCTESSDATVMAAAHVALEDMDGVAREPYPD